MKILRFLATILLAAFSASIVSYATGASPGVLMLGFLAMGFLIPGERGVASFILFDLAKPAGDNAGGGGGIKSEIILIQERDIDWTLFPARAEDGVTITGDMYPVGKVHPMHSWILPYYPSSYRVANMRGHLWV